MSEPQTVNRFAPAMQTLSAEDQGFRQFTAEESGYISTPGCLAIEELRLGLHPIPQYEDHQVPKDLTQKNFDTIRIPNYQLVEGPGGVTAVVRSLNSNDGRWQIGAVIYIKGRWADEESGKKSTKAA